MASLGSFFSNPFGVSDIFGNGLSRLTGQREAFDYQKKLNNLTMAREDNAYQRAVADAQKAGLSPLSVSSGASANSMNTASIDNTGALSFSGDIMKTIFNQINEDRSLRIQNKIADAQVNNLNAQADATRKKSGFDALASAWYEKFGYRTVGWEDALISLANYFAGKSDSPAGSAPPPESFGYNDDGSFKSPPSSSKRDDVSFYRPLLSKGNVNQKTVGFNLDPWSDSWTASELNYISEALNGGYYIPAKYFPSKKEYVSLLKSEGADRANDWLGYTIRSKGESSFKFHFPWNKGRHLF